MAATTEKKTKGKKEAVVTNRMPDYANDPFFMKKREQAIAFVKKHGLPEPTKKK